MLTQGFRLISGKGLAAPTPLFVRWSVHTFICCSFNKHVFIIYYVTSTNPVLREENRIKRVSFLEEIMVWWRRQVTIVHNTDYNCYPLQEQS